MLKIRYLCCIPPVQRVHRRVFYIPLQGICCKQNIQKYQICLEFSISRLLIIHSCIILGNYILGTLQQHSNTLLITKSKMYIGVRQIQVGKRIVLSENKHLNIYCRKAINYFYIVLSMLGWITGHTYVTYGPLLNGATSVIFEGIPFYPSNDRCWQIVQKYKVLI